MLKNTAKNNYMYLLPVLTGAAWTTFIFNSGIRISPDSAHYLSYANHFHHGNQFVHRADWPPLFSLMIATAQYLQPAAADAAAPIIGLSFTILLTSFMLIMKDF